MLNQICKKCICGLIIIAFISAFTACTNNKKITPVDKNIAVNSEKSSNELLESSQDTLKNNNLRLDSWVGDYIFTEYINSKDYTKFYEAFISKENNDYNAKIKIHDEGAGAYSYIQAKINGDTNCIDFIFNDYSPDETNTSKPYNLGDNL